MALESKIVWNGDKKKSNINVGTLIALTRAANLVQSKAKLLAPVDTGNLRGSIVKSFNDKTLSAFVSTNSGYAAYVEFGLRSNPNYPIQPYLRPALNDNVANIKRIFIAEERKAVVK